MATAEIISIGDELLLGRIVNNNAAFLAEKLAGIGIAVRWMTVTGDEKSDIIHAVRHAFERADIILTTGGIGPTHDDITKPALMAFFHSKPRQNPEVLREIEARCRAKNIPVSPEVREMAILPHNCSIIPNPIGAAQGMLFRKDGKILIALPGVPMEMKRMTGESVLPILKEYHPGKVILFRTVKTTGIPESELFSKIRNLEEIEKAARVAFLPGPSGVDIRLTTEAADAEHARKQLALAEKLLMPAVEPWVFATDEDSLEEVVARLLKKTGLRIAVAESCTGGLLAHKLTNIPGSSGYFECGIISYSNAAKENILGVSGKLLERYGAVSEPVARAMAEGVQTISGADIGLSTTGIAGPSGGTETKPVGLLFTAVGDRNGTYARQYITYGDRLFNKERFAHVALMLLRKYLLSTPPTNTARKTSPLPSG